MRILLVRHGRHEEVGRVLSGRSEIALDALGFAQAAALARRLGGQPLAAIHSSPRRRCLQTAAPLAAALRLTVQTTAALDEIDFGDWTGGAFAMLAGDPAWKRWNEARGSACPPNGEGMDDAVNRTLGHLRTIQGEGPVLCVTHCDIIRGVVARLLGMPTDNVLRLECDPASVTTIELWPEGGSVVALNERAA